MGCFWRHLWSKWSEVKLDPAITVYIPYQERVCSRCGFVERRLL